MLPGIDTQGYLGVVLGCMFSGKTSRLVTLYHQYTQCGVAACVINHSSDDRYGQGDMSTHDGKRVPCTRAAKLAGLEASAPIAQARVLLVNEGQFFEDVVEWVEERVERDHKIVFVCGLDGDYTRGKFGQWLDLIPLADEVVKLSALCAFCKSHPAIFSRRLTSDVRQVLIGTDQYAPVCRACYRAEADDSRAEADDSRVDADDSRVDADDSRVDADAGRSNADGSRVNADAGRSDADSSRTSAAADKARTAPAALVLLSWLGLVVASFVWGLATESP
jgi:thymidine kinase